MSSIAIQFKKTILRAAEKLAPSLVQLARSYRFRRHCEKRYGDFQKRIHPLLYEKGPTRILSGPFTNFRYLNQIGCWGPNTPKWIGSYEEELHPFIREVVERLHPRLIVDIGSAEGYYAVGLAAALPGTQMHSFDLDPLARRAQRSLAELNSVSNLHIHGRCLQTYLQSLLSQAPPPSW
jgi:hypothetical protein